MNWLAHIFLSEHHVDFKIGNYLADPLKGKLWQEANDEIKKGMSLHKQIDRFTDSHDLFALSKSRLGSKGLLKAVVIDLTYDYLLTKNWDLYCKIPKQDFLEEFYVQAQKRLPNLPLPAQQRVESLIQHDILNKFESLSDLYESFQRVEYRLSDRLKKRDSMINYIYKVDNGIIQLEEDFLKFFPQLCTMVKSQTNEKQLTHWKI